MDLKIREELGTNEEVENQLIIVNHFEPSDAEDLDNWISSETK
jgi:hypothetical protein